MAAEFQHTQIISRPVDTVFRFVVDEHIRNHPRWDPNIELLLDQEQPIRVGTVIHRQN